MKSKLPHEILLRIANGDAFLTQDGEVLPNIRERIQAANACTAYYAQRHIEKTDQNNRKYQNEVLTYLKTIALNLPV